MGRLLEIALNADAAGTERTDWKRSIRRGAARLARGREVSMRRWLPLLAPLALACAAAQEGDVVRYRCDGGTSLQVLYGVSSARVTVPGQQPADWRQQPSGSGIRYGDGTSTLYAKGREAWVERDGRPIVTGCREGE